VVDTAGAEAALGDFKTTAFAQQHIAGGYAHVFETDFSGDVRRAGKAEDGLAHEDENLAALIRRSGRKPFAPVDDVVVTVTHDGAFHITRPMISHRGAYSRLVSPAPYSDSGRNRFHSPAARAFGFNSSITSGQ